jgi:hypothetical protein
MMKHNIFWTVKPPSGVQIINCVSIETYILYKIIFYVLGNDIDCKLVYLLVRECFASGMEAAKIT